MPQTEPSSPAANPRRFCWRRLVQYRLRTLLILTTVVALWLAWWSYTARQQRHATSISNRTGSRSQINLGFVGKFHITDKIVEAFLDDPWYDENGYGTGYTRSYPKSGVRIYYNENGEVEEVCWPQQ